MNVFYLWKLLNNNLPTPLAFKDGIGGVVHDGKMYALGGWSTGPNMGTTYNTVLFSVDGITWTQSVQPASWSGRHVMPVVSHKGRIFVLGGDQNSGNYQPDVHSWTGDEDEEWEIETLDAPWGNRAGHIAFSLGDYIYVGFGQTVTNLTPAPTTFFTDLWRSETGRGDTWELVNAKCVSGYRGYFSNSPAILDGEAYFIGGGCYDTSDFPTRELKNDVFAMNADGEIRLVNHGKNSPITKLMYHNICAFDGKLWVLAGWNGGDKKAVFMSADKGETWALQPAPPWAVRHAAMCIPFNDKLYFGTGMNVKDMWRMEKIGGEPGMNYGALPNGGTTALSPVYTVIDRSTELTVGKTVDAIGMYRNTPGAMTLKIAKQTGPTSLEIVYSQSVYHDGDGYQDFDITDFEVPNDGASYRIGAAFSTPGPDAFNHSGVGRWLKIGDLTGAQAMSFYADGSYSFRWKEVV